MPTTDPSARLRPEQVAAAIDDLAFPQVDGDRQDAVGLEVEFFALQQADTGLRRRSLAEQAARLDVLAETWPTTGSRLHTSSVPTWPAGRGRLTFEPGGQVEYSGAVQTTAAAALDDADDVCDALAGAWHREGDVLVSVGVDPWTDADQIDQQLDAPRYRAMAAYLADRGPAGRRMMRNTCSLQVNLDPGRGATAERRWRLLNLAAPLITATFACSPAPAPDPAVSLRARSWRQLDATRTGVPGVGRRPEAGSRRVAFTRFALEADVLLQYLPDGSARPGRRGWTFGAWLAEGDDLGWPTVEDLAVHLSTLFPEVRPRGPLEVRAIDAVPRHLRAVPVVLLTGLLYDEQAADAALAVLEPRAGQLQDDLARAGEVGLKDAELCAVAVELWSFALAGAKRLPAGYHRRADVTATERFIDRQVLRGRSPADDFRDLLRDGTAAALGWAAEPVPDPVLELR